MQHWSHKCCLPWVSNRQFPITIWHHLAAPADDWESIWQSYKINWSDVCLLQSDRFGDKMKKHSWTIVELKLLAQQIKERNSLWWKKTLRPCSSAFWRNFQSKPNEQRYKTSACTLQKIGGLSLHSHCYSCLWRNRLSSPSLTLTSSHLWFYRLSNAYAFIVHL